MLVYIDNLKSTLPATSNAMLFDGVRTWVALANKTISVYHFWKKDSLGSVVVNTDKWAIDLSTYLTTGQGVYLAKGYEKVYVFEGVVEGGYEEFIIKSFVELNSTTITVDILSVDDVNDTFTVVGDQQNTFTPNSIVELVNSTDGAIDGLYTIHSRTFDSTNTIVTVVENIMSSPASSGSVVQTLSVIRKVTLPVDAHCVPIYANTKLWFVTKSPQSETSTQSLFYYDTTNSTWSGYTTIPGKRQYEPRKLEWARDYFIFVTGYNESCVYKFDSTTGNYVSQIITNRQPKHLQANNARELRVKGASGMLSTVDQITDTSSNDYTIPDTDWFFEDDTYIWTGAPLTRFQYGSGSDNIRIMGTSLKDFTIEAIDATEPNGFQEVDFGTSPNANGTLTDSGGKLTQLDGGDIYTFNAQIDGGPVYNLQINGPYNMSGLSKVASTINAAITDAEGEGSVSAAFIPADLEADPPILTSKLKVTSESTEAKSAVKLTDAGARPLFSNIDNFQAILPPSNGGGSGEDTFDQIITTPSHTGNFTLCLVGSTLYSLSNLTDSRTLTHTITRDHFTSIQATSMIGVGPDKYYGETT